MDFIEQWFGFSPDGGNGTAELMLFVIIIVAFGCGLIAAVPRWRRALVHHAAER